MDRRRTRYDVAKAERALRFANELSDALHELKIKHKVLAEQLGVGFHTVNSWTRGVDPSVPGEENLDKLCALLEGRRAGLGKRLASLAGHDWEPVPPADEARAPVQLSIIGATSPRNLTNLPLSISSFVGKAWEVAEVSQLVRAQRLVTLTGAGGIGKTRLSLEVARHELASEPRSGGVWWVELAPVHDPGRLEQAVAQSLGVMESAGRPLSGALQEYLQHRSLLLVLDNCEHLVDACAELAAQLLRTCTGLSILATSREALGIGGEFVWRVSALSMPPARPASEQRSPQALAEYEAVQLFLARARSISPAFELTEANARPVEEICRRLDGMPLAIELATALLRYLSPDQVASGLARRFDLLTGGSRDALPRHKTLRATVEWSYDLLSDAEKALFRRMSVFAGDCGLAGVEAVCAGEEVGRMESLYLLSRLVDKSLVQAEMRRGEARYRMLETVREYARKELEAQGEVGTLQARHAMYYTQLAEELGPKIRQPSSATWIERLDTEQDNIVAALHWALEHSAQVGLRLVGALGWYWQLNSTYREGVEWLQRLISKHAETEPVAGGVEPSEEDKHIRAYALFAGAKLGRWCGKVDVAWKWIEESVRLLRELGDETTRLVDALTVHVPLAYLTGKITMDEEVAGIEDALALARKIGDKWGECQLLTGLGLRAARREDYSRAAAYFNENLALARELDNRQHVAGALINLGDVMRVTGDWERARTLYEESLAWGRREGIVWAISVSLAHMARVMLQRGDTGKARSLLAESLIVTGEKQVLLDRAWTLSLLVWALLDEGHTRHACKLMGAASLVLEAVGADVKSFYTRDTQQVAERVEVLLDDPAHKKLWEEGRALDAHEMISFALQVARG